MKRHIDRIYRTKKVHHIDDEYESVGEMHRNIHKKEPYIFTVTATNSVGDSVVSDPTRDVVPLTVPIVSNIYANLDFTRTGIELAFNIVAGGSPVKQITISSDNNSLSLNSTSTTSTIFPTSGSSGTSGINYTSIRPYTTTSENTNYIISLTNLTPNTEYKFTVTATNSIGSSSSTMSNSIYTLSVPDKPTNVTSSINKNNGEVTITFTQPSQIIRSNAVTILYRITAKSSNASELPITQNINATSTNSTGQISKVLTGLNLGTTYNVTVSANNLIGYSQESDTIQITPSRVPDPPTNIIATVNGKGSVEIKFNPPVNDGGKPVTSYTVTSTPGNKTVNGTNSPLTLSNLDDQTSYTFYVISTNANGNSVSSTVSNNITTPSNPSKIIIDNTTLPPTSSNNSVILKFKVPDNGGLPITGYKIRGYYTDGDVIKYEDIGPITSNVSFDKDETNTIKLYTKQQKKYTKTPIQLSDLTNLTETNKSITNTLSLTESYDRVPLLYYPIGNEREGYYYQNLKKTVPTCNKLRNIFLIFIFFIVLYFLINKK